MYCACKLYRWTSVRPTKKVYLRHNTKSVTNCLFAITWRFAQMTGNEQLVHDFSQYLSGCSEINWTITHLSRLKMSLTLKMFVIDRFSSHLPVNWNSKFTPLQTTYWSTSFKDLPIPRMETKSITRVIMHHSCTAKFLPRQLYINTKYFALFASHSPTVSDRSEYSNMQAKTILLVLCIAQVTLAAKWPKCKEQPDLLDYYASIFERNAESSVVKRGGVRLLSAPI